jgi:hypothetical protein
MRLRMVREEITVPADIGKTLIAIGAAVCIDPPPPPEPELPFLAPYDDASIGWRGRIYTAVGGVVMLPVSAMAEVMPHGFMPAQIDPEDPGDDEPPLAIEHRKD